MFSVLLITFSELVSSFGFGVCLLFWFDDDLDDEFDDSELASLLFKFSLFSPITSSDGLTVSDSFPLFKLVWPFKKFE